jgi:hypothetical protein
VCVFQGVLGEGLRESGHEQSIDTKTTSKVLEDESGLNFLKWSRDSRSLT